MWRSTGPNNRNANIVTMRNRAAANSHIHPLATLSSATTGSLRLDKYIAALYTTPAKMQSGKQYHG